MIAALEEYLFFEGYTTDLTDDAAMSFLIKWLDDRCCGDQEILPSEVLETFSQVPDLNDFIHHLGVLELSSEHLYIDYCDLTERQPKQIELKLFKWTITITLPSFKIVKDDDDIPF